MKTKQKSTNSDKSAPNTQIIHSDKAIIACAECKNSKKKSAGELKR